MMRRALLAIAGAIAFCALPKAQPVFTGTEIFPPEEFAARRAKVMAQIGDAVAILQGTTERPGEQPLRQGNQFFYLTGVVEPRAIAVIDGRTRKTTVFLQPYNERREVRMYGPGLHPGEETAKTLGVDAALPRPDFTTQLASIVADSRVVYTPLRPEVLGEASAGDPRALAAATKGDPWDGRISREEQFVQKLKGAGVQTEIKDLDPVLDALRVLKSAREIAVIREATRIAGLGIMEAMRDAKPGMFEYELQADAEFVFKKHGAYGPSYFALIATGRNTLYSHYHRNTTRLQAGDLVQFDYAPDFKYYQSDVTRVFPANGEFTARQREFYGIYVQLYRALMTSIRAHQTPRAIVKEAVGKMDRIMAASAFSDEKIKAAATAFVDRFRTGTANSLGHDVGMEVHDVTRGAAPSLEPGRIFTIEPAISLEDEHLAIRLEDMILVTETGYENLSAFVPVEIKAIERLMAEPGLSDHALRIR